MIALDLSGRRFGRLVARSLVLRTSDKKNRRHWLCQCDCGNQTTSQTTSLTSGHTQSCGCLNRERSAAAQTTHGKYGTPELRIWKAMIRRCYSATDSCYSHYGARGITVCDRWRNGFSDFLADMGPRPSPKHSLDRINNNGNYEPGNVRWVTHFVQSINKRTNVLDIVSVSIIRHLSKKGVSRVSMAHAFGVSIGLIGKLVRGEIWNPNGHVRYTARRRRRIS